MNLPKLYHLHCHSYYSAADSVVSIERYIEKLQQLGLDKSVLTEHGNLFSMIRAKHACNKSGIKHFGGIEFYYVPENIKDDNHRSCCHLTVIAKNQIGYKNLFTLSSNSFFDGYYYKPRIDFKDLQRYSEGLIVSSACVKGRVPLYFLEGKDDLAYEEACKFKELFGNDYYFEIMPHKFVQQRIVNAKLINLSKKLNIELISTCDVHLVEKEDVPYRRFWYETNKFGWSKGDEDLATEDTIYMMSSQELLDAYHEYHMEMTDLTDEIIIKSIENTGKILEECDEYEEATIPTMPIIDLKGKKNSEELIKSIINKRWKELNIGNNPEYIQRLNYEFKILKEAEIFDYFLVLEDFFNYCRKENLYVGSARGSAGASLIAYLLQITMIDPIKFNLDFDRFYNAGRAGSMDNLPDIDIDVASEERSKAIEYLENKYGKENISQVCNISSLQLKSAIKDCARTLNIPIDIANKITSCFEWDAFHNLKEVKITLKGKTDKKSKQVIEFINKYPELFKYVEFFTGFFRQISKHAAAIVIGNESIGNICPMTRTKVTGSDEIFRISQFDKDDVKYTSLIKYDILGLSTMDFLKYIIEDINKEKDNRIKEIKNRISYLKQKLNK